MLRSVSVFRMRARPIEHRVARPEDHSGRWAKAPRLVLFLAFGAAGEHTTRRLGVTENDDETSVLEERLVQPCEMRAHPERVRRMQPGLDEQTLNSGMQHQ